MMTSKKNQGTDPEVVEAIQREGRGQSKAPRIGDAIQHRLRNTPAKTNTPGAGGGGHTSDWYEGRRSLAYELHESGGLGRSQLALEILYLLPDIFITEYEALFHASLTGGGGESVMHGRLGGLDKAAGASGMVTGSDNKLQASGTGKKFKNTPMFIAGDGEMLKIKREVDRKLVELVGDWTRARLDKLQKTNPRTGRSEGVSNSPTLAQCRGRLVAEAMDTGRGGAVKNCGRFLKAEWKYCPQCGTATAKSTT